MVSTLKDPSLVILSVVLGKKHRTYLDSEKVRKKTKHHTVNRSMILREIIDKDMSKKKGK